MTTEGRSGLPAGGLWTKTNTLCVSILVRAFKRVQPSVITSSESEHANIWGMLLLLNI